MEETTELLLVDDIKDLREKTEKDYVNSKLKSTTFGGYRKSDVMNFIAELRDQEINTRETFTGRITELSAAIETMQREHGTLTTALSRANELKNNAQNRLSDLNHECEALRSKAENDADTIADCKQKISEYQSKIEMLKTDYEEVQSAKKYKDLYEKLSVSYKEIADSREEYIKSETKLKQENEYLKSQNERLNSENETLSKNLSELTADVRKSGLDAIMKIETYDETHKYLLGNLVKYTENSLKCLNELEAKELEMAKGVRENLKPYRNI